MQKQKRAQRRSSTKPRKRSGSVVEKNVKIDAPRSTETSIQSSRSSTPPAAPPAPVEVQQPESSDDEILSLQESLSGHSVLTLYMEEAEETESEHREEFFVNFEGIPDIEDISEDISIAYVHDAAEEVLTKEVPDDEGKFVDPLLGLRGSRGSLAAEQSETIRPATPEPESEAKAKPVTDSDQELNLADLIITDSQMLGSQASELNDLILPDETTFFEIAGDGTGDKKHAAEEPKDVLETFFEMVNEKVEEEVEVIDWEAVAREYELEVIKQQAQEFLMELIYKVVNKAEYRSEDDILAQSLDKRKLLVLLAEKCIEYDAEITYNHMLDQKITKHLIRKKIFSQITPSKQDAASKPKYDAALWKIEKHLTRESATRNKYETIKNGLLQELKECEEKSQAEIQAFETLVKLKLSGNNLENLNHRILPHVSEMREFRKRISATRFRLILLEDTHAKLKIKLAELEHLSNDLTVTDYYNLYHQNQGLQKKLEERENDLQKLHYRLQRHIHILAHYGETKARLFQVIGMQRFELAERKFEREYLRRHLQKLTLQRIRTRQQIQEMSLNAGLLDKPLLMYDYDNTMKILKVERERVSRLRATVATLQSKINALEKRLSTNLSIKGKASIK